ncbi:MAG: isocitrate lyase/phosphoenolpyruvate mutase family protein [Anaerolineales bacterium]|nr:isocitrate lyase/phosphoenolpyruvate mutase family protein [Anaerolineales bacterium]
MLTTEQTTKAEKLLSLHTNGQLLILPNIWNPIGARVLESKGYPAVATASAAIAESLGYADGENIRFETMLEMLTRIARSVDVPVTADIEAGYASTVSELKDSIHEVLKTGVVGINIEDSLVEGVSMRSVREQCERIAAVREAADQYGVHLVINARVDSFFLDSLGAGQEKLEDAVARANAYAEAGADCIYPIGPGDRETVSLLRQRIVVPLNILATPNAVSLTDLQRLGINRVSFGPFIFRSLLAKFVRIADELKDFGPYSVFAEQSMSGKDVTKFLISGKE